MELSGHGRDGKPGILKIAEPGCLKKGSSAFALLYQLLIKEDRVDTMIKKTTGISLCLLTFLSLASMANATALPSASGGYTYTTIIPPVFKPEDVQL
jgi:hypothetical protein